MHDDLLIKADTISKKFCRNLKTSLWYGFQDIGNEIFGRNKHSHDALRKSEFWAVRDVSFKVKRGECLGLIGRNGAGKSTLLKMLNGLIKPDKGRIEMRGRVGALIELGAGFNPILTGRENIYNNAAVLGFTKKEVDKKLDAIVAFSELEDFLDSPVQYYSSGMRVRLGFSVAAHLEPDILLIDEVLAVGDIGFVLKCFNKMDALQPDTAIIFVSHSMPNISRMCTQLMMMSEGAPIYHSQDVSRGISEYYKIFPQTIGNFIGSDKAALESVALISGNKKSSADEVFEIELGDALAVHLRIRLNVPVIQPDIYLAFYDKEQRNFAEIMNFRDFIQMSLQPGVHEITAMFKEMPLDQGTYSITVALSDRADNGKDIIFRLQSAIFFNVHSKIHGWAPIQFTPEWTRS